MTITKTREGSRLTLALTGRLDNAAAPRLRAALKESIGGVTELTLDFAGVETLSQAGLRVLLSAQKAMNRQGRMTVIHASKPIRDAFEDTGFVDVLTIR